MPAAEGQSAQVTALATAVGTSLTGWFGKVVAILLAAFFCSSPSFAHGCAALEHGASSRGTGSAQAAVPATAR